jgi:hypothetical protein
MMARKEAMIRVNYHTLHQKLPDAQSAPHINGSSRIIDAFEMRHGSRKSEEIRPRIINHPEERTVFSANKDFAELSTYLLPHR